MESVDPRRPVRLPGMLKLLLICAWLLTACVLLRDGWIRCGSSFQILLSGNEWHSAAFFLIIPPLLVLSGRLLMSLFRSLQYREEQQREERRRREAQEIAGCLDHCVRIGRLLALEALPPDASQPGIGTVNSEHILCMFGQDPLLARLLSSFADKRCFSAKSAAKALQISIDDAVILAGSLVTAGYLLCTRPMQYTWSALACAEQ